MEQVKRYWTKTKEANTEAVDKLSKFEKRLGELGNLSSNLEGGQFKHLSKDIQRALERQTLDAIKGMEFARQDAIANLNEGILVGNNRSEEEEEEEDNHPIINKGDIIIGRTPHSKDIRVIEATDAEGITVVDRIGMRYYATEEMEEFHEEFELLVRYEDREDV